MVKKIFGQCYIWLILILMYLPVLVLIAFSFTDSDRVGQWNGFSFDLYPRLFQDEAIMTALGNTVLIAIISSVLATLIGTLGAVGAFYSKKKMRNTIDVATQIPVVNAEIVVAFSLTVMFVFLGNLLNAYLFSFWTLLIGHMCLSVPFVYISVKPKLQQMDPSLYEAALDLGCSPSQALGKVVVPEIMPGIFSGFLLAVTLSLDDFIVTAFTRGSGLLSGEKKIETLSTYIQAKIKRTAVPPEMRALTTLLFILVVVGVVGVSIYRNYKANKIAARVRRG
ncbi:MAG: ABC transporter permease [Bacilli bacterium]|nr:ABC transporter permease [Bacilli bacterium]